MNWLIDNISIIVILIVVVFVCCAVAYNFLKLPREEQIVKVKEWLKYAVAMAEKEYGSGTGQLKLRYVYDLFVSKFTWIAKVIPFELFSSWVDEALSWFNAQLEKNTEIKKLVEGEK